MRGLGQKQGGNIMSLTVKRIDRLSVPGRYRDDGDLRGLYLQVGPNGKKSWLLRFQRDGRERWMGLGPYPVFSLEQARARALKQRQLIHDGIDPLEAKHAERERRRREESERKAAEAKLKTFAECAEAFLDVHSNTWTNVKHRAQWKMTLERYAFPTIGKLYVADIDTPNIVAVLNRDNLWNTKQVTARRLLKRIEKVLDYATVSKYRTGDNPARWTNNLNALLPRNGGSNGHHAALHYTEVPAFMVALRKVEASIYTRALEFTILTAARTGEVIGATWGEMDLKAKTWTIPANRMEAGKEHKVPLTDSAIAILRDLPREQDNPFVFIGPKQRLGLSNMAMFWLLRRMKRSDITVHGFRSSFMDWCHEQTAFPKVVIDMALAHSIGDKVEEAYRRGDLFNKRKLLMQAWEKYCASTPTTTATESNVIAMRS
jgi:integrase